ncbi:MAG TPA: tetratricopeptide repeat protein, partial [Gammaproteobacteria bacterium]|nr:tetratricopeptide repeat protein [Gammaproteobacteria bacterium]
RNSLTTAKATNTALIDKKKALSKKLTAANVLGTQLSQDINIAQAATQTLKQQYEQLIATLAAVDATNAALVNENQTLSARASVLGQQRTQEKRTETSLNTQLENITIAYIALEKTNKATLNEKLILTTNLNSLTQRLAEQANEKTALNDQIDTLTTTHQELETTNTTLIGEKKTSENRISELQSLLENNKDSTTALTTKIDGLKEHQQVIIASEKALTAQKVLLEQALDQQHLSAELLETENISLINRVQLLEKQESAALARTDKPGATNESLTQPDSHSDRSKLSTEAIDSFNNGLTLITQGRFDEAIKVYEELIKTFPRFPQPYNNLAGVFASLGNLERAESLLRQGLELDDRYRLLRKNLGSLLIHRASRIYREAIDGEKETNAPIGDEPISLQAFDMLSPTQ